jgi:acetyltransferase-like isoleucine patch superfamily enzyme
MANSFTCWFDRQQMRFERKMELARGNILRLRGAKAGKRFGIGRFVRALYPYCLVVGDDVTISEFSYLHCLAERGVRFGNNTSIDRNLWLSCGGTDADYSHGFFEIGDHSFIGCNAVIGAGGGVCIGNHVLIGQSVNMHAENHRFRESGRLICEQGVSFQGIVIEDDVWIGSKVTILDGVTLGQGAVIGAGAVVTKSMPAYAIAVGVPAKIVGYRDRGKLENRNLP